ncbi:MAG: bifunctional ADP-dependent (S)-NAD(P)H-hydrate dehydratase/NAD(P)H-hydrate epimerase [Geobacteraceae bacterium GWC2_53_11]|nr:MAG: bifunctional ADP-dependent (S)-NAD(P)H-hydrate dehydratase/NAD(P)H-hydrate epimerase [Geobacteraceae bacterium GWC2_53_11]
MRVVTAHTMQEIDKQAIKEYGIPGLQLMECAGRSCVEEVIAEFGLKGRCVVMAGKGNNGGDGYVIARQLGQKGWSVKVIILADRDQVTGDAAVNLEKLQDTVINYCTHEGQLSALHMEEIFQADVIVDALLGTGLRSNVSGVYLEAIDLMNASGRPVVAVDIPSGIHGTTGRVLGDAVRAYITVTFAFAKLGHVLYPGAEHTGRLVVADVGIPAALMETASGYDFLNTDTMRPMLRRRDRQAHKGHYGHCLILAGSTGMTGSAALAANSAVRAGSGLVTLGVAESIHPILEIKTTEAMTTALPDSGSGHLTNSAFPAIEKMLAGKDAVAIGPGFGRRPGTYALVQNLVETVSLPLVIDADGLNALAEDITVLKRKKSKQVILTPHPGEMSRLLGTSIPDVEAIRISVAQEFARSNGVYLVLKGARTIIASPTGTAAINGSGNPGMATGGMGDVLTGIIVSLLGQGYGAWDACRLGVFLHGFAADMVAEEMGEIGINASDVLEKLPYAYNKLLKNTLLSNLRMFGEL